MVFCKRIGVLKGNLLQSLVSLAKKAYCDFNTWVFATCRNQNYRVSLQHNTLIGGDGNETPRPIFYQVGVHGISQDLSLDASTAEKILKSQTASERFFLLTAEDEATKTSG